MSLLRTDASAPPQHPEVTPLTTLSKTGQTLYAALVATAQAAAAARGYVASTTHVTVHCPVDIVALSLGRHRVTVWRAVNKLRALGLVDARAHKTTAPGISDQSDDVNDGTLWCIRLDPYEGAPARLTFEEMKHAGWRDLSGDRKRGRTAHRAVQEHRAAKMQQSQSPTTEGFNLELLLEWALPPQHSETPLQGDCCVLPRADFETVLDVRFAAREDRREAVDGAARALAGGLADRGGLNFYRWLIWQLLRLEQNSGAAPWGTIYEQAKRAQADVREGFARGAKNDGSGGGLFVSRLKASPWWDELQRASGRVGLAPVEA